MFYGVGTRPSSFKMGGDHKNSHPDCHLDALGINRALFLFPTGITNLPPPVIRFPRSLVRSQRCKKASYPGDNFCFIATEIASKVENQGETGKWRHQQ